MANVLQANTCACLKIVDDFLDSEVSNDDQESLALVFNDEILHETHVELGYKIHLYKTRMIQFVNSVNFLGREIARGEYGVSLDKVQFCSLLTKRCCENGLTASGDCINGCVILDQQTWFYTNIVCDQLFEIFNPDVKLYCFYLDEINRLQKRVDLLEEKKKLAHKMFDSLNRNRLNPEHAKCTQIVKDFFSSLSDDKVEAY